MDEDEELFREMNEEDDFYMGGDDYDDQDDVTSDYDDQDDDTPDYDEIQHHNSRVHQSNQGGGMGCLVMLPLLAGALTFVVIVIANI